VRLALLKKLLALLHETNMGWISSAILALAGLLA
jgi:hypothetical protein